jgi:hypothetical protein
VAQRRKKTKAEDKAEEATPKKPRTRKARTKSPENEAVPAPEASGPDEGTSNANDRAWEAEPPSGEDTLPSQNPASGGPRVLLPGELYRRQDQWWWRVQLPGEDKATARPLKTNGEETPADSRGDACVARTTAEKVALALWEHAVEENTARRIRVESTEKIERLKAQFLDKVRHFTELVETANARLEAEQRARADAEARLAQMLQAAGPMRQTAGQAGLETPAPSRSTAPVPVPVAAQPALDGAVIPTADPSLPLETGLCECCGATGIALTHLTRIDSGQFLCPRCLAALRTEAARST